MRYLIGLLSSFLLVVTIHDVCGIWILLYLNLMLCEIALPLSIDKCWIFICWWCAVLLGLMPLGLVLLYIRCLKRGNMINFDVSLMMVWCVILWMLQMLHTWLLNYFQISICVCGMGWWVGGWYLMAAVTCLVWLESLCMVGFMMFMLFFAL